MPLKSYFIITISVLSLNIYIQESHAGTACRTGSPTGTSSPTSTSTPTGTSSITGGGSCSTDTTVTSKPLTITRIPFLHTETLDLGCNGEMVGLIDIKKIPAKVVFFGMTLDIVKLPYEVLPSAPYTKGKCAP